MKKKKWIIFVMCMMSILFLAACSSNNANTETEEHELDVNQIIESVSTYSTLKCKFHNVAIGAKKAPKSLLSAFKKDRKFWIVYDCDLKMGIDASKMKIDVEGSNVKVTIPEAKITEISIGEKQTHYESKDGLLIKNKITAADYDEAISLSKDQLYNATVENFVLLKQAQKRAELLVENQIQAFGKIYGKEYTVTFDEIPGETSADISEGKTSDISVNGINNDTSSTPVTGGVPNTINYQGKLLLYVIDKESGEPIKGATYDLCDDSGNVIESLTTDKDGKAETKQYDIYDFYGTSIKEKSASDGYTLNDEEFEISEEEFEDLINEDTSEKDVLCLTKCVTNEKEK